MTAIGKVRVNAGHLINVGNGSKATNQPAPSISPTISTRPQKSSSLSQHLLAAKAHISRELPGYLLIVKVPTTVAA